MRTAVLVLLIYAAADALPLDKEMGTSQVGTPEVKQKVTTRSRLPHVGPIPFLVYKAEILGKPPAKAAPDKAPYFGKRPAAMPPVHFMTPQRAEEAKPAVPANPIQPLKKKPESAPPPMPQ